MKQYLIKFQAQYYCQGYEWGEFTMLVSADSFEDACKKLREYHTGRWERKTIKDIINCTI